ncbi:MAG: fibronectin type III domain-containing protein [Spirochaetaceae bacterium]|nr:fibronectin type III domain-containing protein [Spirochaetaceae bacterium]
MTGLTGTPGDTSVTLTWTDPTDADLASIEITWTPGNGSGTVAKGAGTYTATGLTNKTAYTFTVRAVDNAFPNPNKSFGETVSKTPLAPTAQVTVSFTGLPQDETIILNGTQNLSWSADTPITVSVGGSFTGYRWKLDNVIQGETGNTFTRTAKQLSIKNHELTVFVTTGGVEYAKAVTFTVTYQ